MLVSFTNNVKMDSLFIILGKSLMYNKNSTGLMMETCDTPCLISDHFESATPLYFIVK